MMIDKLKTLTAALALAAVVSVPAVAKKAAKKAPDPVPAQEVVTVPAPAEADTVVPKPFRKFQAPGFFRVMLGKMEVTALFDGAFPFDKSLMKGGSDSEIEKIIVKHYGKTAGIESPVNAYLVNTGRELVLFDVGCGQLFSKEAQGLLVKNLKAAGYEPADVDVIVMTHLHGDHAGGLADEDGSVVFKNAKIYTNKIEADYWLSEQQAADAPLDRQIFFKLARQSAAPYFGSDKWKTFKPGDTIVEGIRALPAYGHTPGHTAYLVSSEGQRLIIWGDVLFNQYIQFDNPDIGCVYDVDMSRAVATRKMFLRQVAKEHVLVASSHIAFPGIGRVVELSDGTYQWNPHEYRITDREECDARVDNCDVKPDAKAKAKAKKAAKKKSRK